MFDAQFDRQRRRLSIRYAGFWSDQDVARVIAQFRAEVTNAARGGMFTLLEDLRDFPVQSSSVIEASATFVAIVDSAPISRDAMIASSALLRAQLRRQPGSTTPYAIFAEQDEAERWLAEVEPQP